MDIGGLRQGPQAAGIGGENTVAAGANATTPDLRHHPPLVTGTRPASRSPITSATTPRPPRSTAANAPRIQDQHQAAPRPPRALPSHRGCGAPRTTTARPRALRAASRISSAEISPCSAS